MTPAQRAIFAGRYVAGRRRVTAESLYPRSAEVFGGKKRLLTSVIASAAEESRGTIGETAVRSLTMNITPRLHRSGDLGAHL